MIPEQFRISSATHEEVFDEIKEFVFSKVKPVVAPVAIVVGAQPGSGKTNLINASREDLGNNS